MKAAEIACVVLASGQSNRFGDADKLSANLSGKPVISYVLKAAQEVGFGEIFCVVKPGFPVTDPGVSWIENETSAAGQGNALQLGLRALRRSGWENSIIMLGDMPLVKSSYLKKMIEKTPFNQSSISESETIRMPPALFRLDVIDRLLLRKPSFGAREMIDDLNFVTVPLDPIAALDVDTPADLARVTRVMESYKI